MPFAARWSQNIGCKAITTWLRRTPSEFSSFPANSRPRSHHPILSTYARKQIAVLNEQDQGADGAGAEDGRGKCRVGHAKRQPGFQESLLITPSVQAAHLSPPPTRGASSCARKSRLPPIRRPRTLSIFLEPADFSVGRLWAHRYGAPLIAVAVDPDALVSPMTTWCQLSISRRTRISRSGRRRRIAGGWGRIITRWWRRRTARYRAPNDRARGDAAKNAQTYRAAETACVCIDWSKRD
jgi:hypothetical protein